MNVTESQFSCSQVGICGHSDGQTVVKLMCTCLQLSARNTPEKGPCTCANFENFTVMIEQYGAIIFNASDCQALPVTMLMNAHIPLMAYSHTAYQRCCQLSLNHLKPLCRLHWSILCFFYHMPTKYDLPAPNRTTIYAGVFNPTNCVYYHK